jgi:ubiquinone/menaquinone biosynthesis C-methylase UbiE
LTESADLNRPKILMGQTLAQFGTKHTNSKLTNELCRNIQNHLLFKPVLPVPWSPGERQKTQVFDLASPSKWWSYSALAKEAKMEAQEFVEKQRDEWNAAAPGWDQWWATFEKGGADVAKRMVDLAKINEGDSVLDIATGVGEPALTAAARVGASGKVVGTDLSPKMLEIAKSRAAKDGRTNVSWEPIAADALQFDADSFDAVVCRWGLMFMPELSVVVKKIAAVTKPGGRLVAAVWATPDKATMMNPVMGTVMKMFNPPKPPPGTPGAFALADPTPLIKLLEENGYQDVATERMDVTLEWSSSAEYVEFVQQVAIPVLGMLSKLPPEKQEEVWVAIKGAAEQMFGTADKLASKNECIVISATLKS